MDKITLGDVTFDTLVAVTPEEHTTGLMHKFWPPPIMSFPYNRAYVRKFWMKNTPSPLDIIFCRNNKIIAICTGEPFSTNMLGPEEPSDLVIELPKGTALKCGIVVGDNVSVHYSSKTIARIIKGGIFYQL